MNWFCWHVWTKWGEPEIVYTQVYPNQANTHLPGDLKQRRECTKCNKIEHRRP